MGGKVWELGATTKDSGTVSEALIYLDRTLVAQVHAFVSTCGTI